MWLSVKLVLTDSFRQPAAWTKITLDIQCYGVKAVAHSDPHVQTMFCLSAGCYKITTVFSHAQTVVLCVGCSTVLCQPTGGKARLTEGMDCANLCV